MTIQLKGMLSPKTGLLDRKLPKEHSLIAFISLHIPRFKLHWYRVVLVQLFPVARSSH